MVGREPHREKSADDADERRLKTRRLYSSRWLPKLNAQRETFPSEHLCKSASSADSPCSIPAHSCRHLLEHFHDFVFEAFDVGLERMGHGPWEQIFYGEFDGN